MAKNRLKVGVIGVGAIAHDRHLPYWKELESEGRVEVIGVCDILPERVEMIGRKFEVEKRYRSAAVMLRSADYDIIDICTQNRGHAPLTIQALEAGANVLVEKPMAMNVKECREMIRVAQKANRKLMVAQHQRFEARSEQIKEAIRRGDLGEIYYAHGQVLRRRGIPGWSKFHIKKESRGGPVIDIGVHVIDLAVWLMGCPKPMAASGKVYRMFGDRDDLCNAEWGENYVKKEFDVEDFAAAFIRFQNNITMSVQVSWAANIPESVESLNILGDKAGATTIPPAIYGYGRNALTSTRFDWLPEQEGHRMEIRHFTECIEKNKPVLVKPEESLEIQKIIDAIYESSQKNREILIR